MRNAGSETSRRRREIVNSSFITSPSGLTHTSGERTASRLSQTSFFVGGPFDFSRLAVVASLAQVIGGGPYEANRPIFDPCNSRIYDRQRERMGAINRADQRHREGCQRCGLAWR